MKEIIYSITHEIFQNELFKVNSKLSGSSEL